MDSIKCYFQKTDEVKDVPFDNIAYAVGRGCTMGRDGIKQMAREGVIPGAVVKNFRGKEFVIILSWNYNSNV